MRHVRVSSTQELRQVLAEFDGKALFRGQTAHYPKDGHASIATSFDRKGCIPSEMPKWCRYAGNVLDVYLGEAGKSADFTQALLQHYGWRSFYVDCSATAAVAAWFASHKYAEKNAIELCEDYEERPVMLIKRMAQYGYEEGEGHLYVFDKAVTRQSVGLIDLAALRIDDACPRMAAQDAWLLGPLSNQVVPTACFAAHITGSRAVFRDYAAEEGIVDTDRLFPSSKEDPLLRVLLGLPWKKVREPQEGIGIPIFRRALDVQEYHDSFVKIAARRTAFYQGAGVTDYGSIDGGKYGGIAVRVPEIALFGVAREAPLRFPKVAALLAKHRAVAFEIDELIQHANLGGTQLYQKGIVVTAHEPDLVDLCELAVEHPGLDLTRAGMILGWYHRIGSDGLWTREAHPEQCNCGNDDTHLRRISALHIIERYLAAPETFG
jgi:hypothetical protein